MIKNAVDAMEQVPIKRLTIQTFESDGQVVMRVSDTGPGIPEAQLENIYAPDFTTKPEGKGTGLGLASVKTMVDAYGGSIQLASTSGQGTTFDIRLPTIGAGATSTQRLKRTA